MCRDGRWLIFNDQDFGDINIVTQFFSNSVVKPLTQVMQKPSQPYHVTLEPGFLGQYLKEKESLPRWCSEHILTQLS